MTESLFPEIPAVEAVPTARLSAGRKLTQRRVELVERGYHPLANVMPGLRLHPDRTLTCGGCANLMRHSRNRDYLKCGNWPSHSDASDVRLKWPACVNWKDGGADQ